MSGYEREPAGNLEIPVITEDFLQAYSAKFPTSDSRDTFLREMHEQMRERQEPLYRFIHEEAFRVLRTRFPLNQIQAPLGTVRYHAVDIYSALTEQKQLNAAKYTSGSPPDAGRIIAVSTKAIDQYYRYDQDYKKKMTEGRGDVIGPLGKVLTYTHVYNPLLFERVRGLFQSQDQAERVAATTSLAMLAVIAIQARQAPFSR